MARITSLNFEEMEDIGRTQKPYRFLGEWWYEDDPRFFSSIVNGEIDLEKRLKVENQLVASGEWERWVN